MQATAGVVTAGGGNQRRIRNFLIDARFQLPWVLAIVALVAAVFGTLGAYIVWQENTASQGIVDGLNQLYSEDEVALMADLFTRSDRTVLWSLIAAGSGLVLVLAIGGVVMTHRVAGPMYALIRSLRSLRDGRYGDVRPFRRGDAFQGVSGTVQELTASLRARELADLAALEALRAQTLPVDARVALEAILADRRARLGA